MSAYETKLYPLEAIDRKRHMVATYLVETSEGFSFDKVGGAIATELSTGTWTSVHAETPKLQRKSRAKVIRNEKLGEENGRETVLSQIAFPVENISERGGIGLIMSTFGGNAFGMSDFRNFRVIDLELPKQIVSRFNGPNFGIEGMRKILETEKSRRPHLGTIVKPNVGLTPSEFQDIAYEAAAGGVDFVKDDELLVDPDYCPIEERAAAASEALDRGEDETGRRALYACNITDRADRIVDTAQDAIDNGAPCLMVNVITAGFSALRALAEANLDVPIHVHRNFHAAFTRNPKHGVKMSVIAKLVRMAGGDQLHTGTAAGKMEGQGGEVRMINDFLRGDWHGLKTTFPVASGGIHPGLVKRNVEILGNDIIIQAGGGIHGHPDGIRSGAKAMRQAIEASMKERSIEDYAETHEELKKAIEYWGTA